MLITDVFKRLHYPTDMMAQCVRWYLAYSLSLGNLEEMMSEQGIPVDHSTLRRWVLRINRIAARYKKSVNQFRHMDESYIKIKATWHDLYRAIDSRGKKVDFLLTKRGDMLAVRRFFKNAISKQAGLICVAMDKCAANKKVVDSFNTGFTRFKPITIRQHKYMNNRIE